MPPCEKDSNECKCIKNNHSSNVSKTVVSKTFPFPMLPLAFQSLVLSLGRHKVELNLGESVINFIRRKDLYIDEDTFGNIPINFEFFKFYKFNLSLGVLNDKGSLTINPITLDAVNKAVNLAMRSYTIQAHKKLFSQQKAKLQQGIAFNFDNISYFGFFKNIFDIGKIYDSLNPKSYGIKKFINGISLSQVTDSDSNTYAKFTEELNVCDIVCPPGANMDTCYEEYVDIGELVCCELDNGDWGCYPFGYNPLD